MLAHPTAKGVGPFYAAINLDGQLFVLSDKPFETEEQAAQTARAVVDVTSEVLRIVMDKSGFVCEP